MNKNLLLRQPQEYEHVLMRVCVSTRFIQMNIMYTWKRNPFGIMFKWHKKAKQQFKKPAQRIESKEKWSEARRSSGTRFHYYSIEVSKC